MNITYCDGQTKNYEVISKIRFGNKSLNFTDKVRGLIIIDYVNINSFLIL